MTHAWDNTADPEEIFFTYPAGRPFISELPSAPEISICDLVERGFKREQEFEQKILKGTVNVARTLADSTVLFASETIKLEHILENYFIQKALPELSDSVLSPINNLASYIQKRNLHEATKGLKDVKTIHKLEPDEPAIRMPPILTRPLVNNTPYSFTLGLDNRAQNYHATIAAASALTLISIFGATGVLNSTYDVVRNTVKQITSSNSITEIVPTITPKNHLEEIAQDYKENLGSILVPDREFSKLPHYKEFTTELENGIRREKLQLNSEQKKFMLAHMYAIAHRESSHNDNIQASSAGAIGYMQVLPTTAMELDGIKVDDLQSKDEKKYDETVNEYIEKLSTPETCIKYGTKKWVKDFAAWNRRINKFYESTILSDVSYNSGFNRAEQYQFTTKPKGAPSVHDKYVIPTMEFTIQYYATLDNRIPSHKTKS